MNVNKCIKTAFHLKYTAPYPMIPAIFRGENLYYLIAPFFGRFNEPNT